MLTLEKTETVNLGTAWLKSAAKMVFNQNSVGFCFCCFTQSVSWHEIPRVCHPNFERASVNFPTSKELIN
jgi:hypothetical protein